MPYEYRKHWAKGMDHMDPQYIMTQFPRLEDFLEIVHELDPDGKFQNEHVQLWLSALTVTAVANAGDDEGIANMQQVASVKQTLRQASVRLSRAQSGLSSPENRSR